MSEFSHFPVSKELGLQAWSFFNWSVDPYARGAWSIPLYGFSPLHQKLLSVPLSKHFVLAGEHCSERNSASVHGACETGIKAAGLMASDMDLKEEGEDEGEHVVIIGSGAAGISAALELRRINANVRISILEARDRLLGRVNTISLGAHGGSHDSVDYNSENAGVGSTDSVRVDMGANWLHACHEETKGYENSLYAYVKEKDLEVNPSSFWNPLGAAEDGKDCDDADVDGTCGMAGLLMCEARLSLRKLHRKRNGSMASELDDMETYANALDEITSDDERRNSGDEGDDERDRSESCVFDYDDACENMPVDADIDMSISQALQNFLSAASAKVKRMAALALRGVIGIDSGWRFDQMSAHWLFEQPGPGYGDYFLTRGFADIFEHKLQELKPKFKADEALGAGSDTGPQRGDTCIWLSTPVEEIDWSATVRGAGPVVVRTSKGTITADRCICTVPVNVLKAKAIKMVPEMPPKYRRALMHIGMSCVAKIALRFETRWWPTQVSEDRNILHWYGPACHFNGVLADDVPAVKWVEWLDVTDAHGVPTLIGFIAGDEVERMRGKSDQEIAEEACAQLKDWRNMILKMKDEGLWKDIVVPESLGKM